MELKVEYLGEDQEYPGSKLWKVEAIHVTTTRNKRKYTESELREGGRSLSFRPLNINHDQRQQLPFPENATMFMEYDSASKSVKGKFRVTDMRINQMIENHRINQVSIEQLPTKGETCNEVSCEQHGVAFIGMALLESDILPGDKNADIMRESYRVESLIAELIVSDGQRMCKECTDSVKCHKCTHLKEAEDCVEACLRAKKTVGKKIDDQAIAICMSECGKSNKEETWRIFKKYEFWKE